MGAVQYVQIHRQYIRMEILRYCSGMSSSKSWQKQGFIGQILGRGGQLLTRSARNHPYRHITINNTNVIIKYANFMVSMYNRMQKFESRCSSNQSHHPRVVHCPQPGSGSPALFAAAQQLSSPTPPAAQPDQQLRQPPQTGPGRKKRTSIQRAIMYQQVATTTTTHLGNTRMLSFSKL